MDFKKIAIIIVALIFLGEMLFVLFVNSPPPQQESFKGEFLSAMIRGRVIGINNILTTNEAVAKLLKDRGCSSLKIGEEYSITCDTWPEFLQLNNSQVKYTIALEKATTIKGSYDLYQETKVTLPFYVGLNSSLDFRGTATLVNDTLQSVVASELYTFSKNITENATISKILAKEYIYHIPFDLRNNYRKFEGAKIRDVVYTNITLEERPAFVRSVGEGFILVSKNATLEEIKNYYTDAVPYDNVVSTNTTIDELEGVAEKDTITQAILSTSIGEVSVSLPGDYKEGDVVEISLEATMSGDVVISYTLELVEQETS